MKKITVMLPQPYKDEILRGAKIFAKSLALMARVENADLQVVFSYVQNADYDPNIDFSDLREMGISLRQTRWEVFNIKEAQQYKKGFMESQLTRQLAHEEYCLPKDGLNDFFDCDLWIIISDRLPAPIYPVRKYACVAYDYIQRYVPGIFNEVKSWGVQEAGYLAVARGADRLFVTTPSTLEDAVSYAGVAREKVRLLPMNFEPLEASSSLEKNPPYFLWATNSSLHKNHIHALKALEIYYGQHKGMLDVLVTGDYVTMFDPSSILPSAFDVPHVREVRKILTDNPEVARRVRFRHLSDSEYADALSSAKFLWHTTLYDNGAYAALDAAYLNVPALSARYPAMEFMDRNFSLNLTYFDPTDVQAMAKSLLWMQENCSSISLPSKEIMQNYGWKANAATLYQAVMELL